MTKKRNYEISGRDNLEKLKAIDIAILHSEKNKNFLNMVNSYQQYHYKRGYLIKQIYNILIDPYSAKELSNKFKRSKARITKILVNLKKENKIFNYRVYSKTYWIRKDQNVIIISKRKEKILKFLKNPRLTSEVADNFKITWKAAFRRLKELNKLNLIIQDTKGYWSKQKCKKKVMVL